ncbi:MAG: TVP38/TMEM64 family protein [Acutalibacter sp.]
MEKREQQKKRAAALVGLGLVIAFMIAVFWFVGKPMLQFVSEPDRFRAWVDGNGIWGRLAFVGMMMFQVFVAIIPGEPLEIGAGYAFGAVEGTVLCILATTLSSVVIFLIVKRCGMKFVTLFVEEEKIRSLKFLQNARRLNLIAFLLFFIPGTPKDVLTYIVGLTPMRLRTWVLISTVARIPSVITSTIGGDALGTQNYLFAVVVFLVTGLISGLGVLAYRKITQHHQKKEQEREAAGELEKTSSSGVEKPVV